MFVGVKGNPVCAIIYDRLFATVEKIYQYYGTGSGVLGICYSPKGFKMGKKVA